jgi:hypothetical protein
MLLKNLFEYTDPSTDTTGMQDLQQDNSVAMKTDTRKTRLTLEQINKLRQLNDVKMVEYHKKVEQVRKQFGQQSQES